MVLRAWVVAHLLNASVPCPLCLGATAMQQDCVLLAIFLVCAAFSLFFRSYLLQLPFLLLTIALLIAHAIDSVVLLTLSQRLYVFDMLKFGKELGATWEFALIFLHTGAGKIFGAIGVLAVLLVGCLLIPRPRRPRLGGALLAAAAVAFAFGLWQPSTMAYIHAEVLQNVLAVNLDLNTDRAYSAAFIADVKRNLKPESPICRDANANTTRPNILYVLVESLSMHHSQLFSGARDLTPNLDSIARQYTYLPDFYANGFATDAGLIALLTGRPPIPAIGHYQSHDAFRGFDDPTNALPDVLHRESYDVNFFTTGDLAFLDKATWLRALHFDHFEGAENSYYEGWKRRHFNAAEDKALYQRFLQWLDQRTPGSPWFSMLLTVSTHPPFINPENEQPDEPGAFRYADAQIGMLFQELKKRNFFDNGILLISGDHRSMTPLLAQEQVQFGNSALARVPMVIATNLPMQHGSMPGAFQQTDLITSIENVTGMAFCHTPEQGIFLGEHPTPPTYIEHARGDRRDRLAIYFTDVDAKSHEGDIVLSGDASHWIGDRPDDWQQIMLRVAADRIKRGGDAENGLDYVIGIYFPRTPAAAPVKPSPRQSQ